MRFGVCRLYTVTSLPATRVPRCDNSNGWNRRWDIYLKKRTGTETDLVTTRFRHCRISILICVG
jgi:hypothetical protein